MTAEGAAVWAPPPLREWAGSSYGHFSSPY